MIGNPAFSGLGKVVFIPKSDLVNILVSDLPSADIQHA